MSGRCFAENRPALGVQENGGTNAFLATQLLAALYIATQEPIPVPAVLIDALQESVSIVLALHLVLFGRRDERIELFENNEQLTHTTQEEEGGEDCLAITLQVEAIVPVCGKPLAQAVRTTLIPRELKRPPQMLIHRP